MRAIVPTRPGISSQGSCRNLAAALGGVRGGAECGREVLVPELLPPRARTPWAGSIL